MGIRCKGGVYHSDGFKYSGSDQIDEVAWFEDNAAYQPKKIGLKLPNQLGIYDMSGNVWEWCFDWFSLYTSDNQVNPTGPVSSYNGNKISRGGSSWVGNISCEVDNRDMREPYVAPADMGIRVVIPE